MIYEKYYKIRLEVITPIHIGHDEVFTPLEFVIDKDMQKMIVFSLFDLLNCLTPEESSELEKISDMKGVQALVNLYRFYAYRIKDKVKNLPGIKSYKVPMELANRYEEILKYTNERDILRNFNAFEIPRTYFNPYTDEPVIPGSSLKGALRTGYLTSILSNLNHTTRRKENLQSLQKLLENISRITVNTPKKVISKLFHDLEKTLLEYDEIKEDPFNLLKISDLTCVNNISTEILYAVNVSKSKGEIRGRLTLPLEVIPSGAVFEGTLTIESKRRDIKEGIDFNKLIEGAFKHYFRSVYNKEKKDILEKLGFKNIPISLNQAQALKEKKAVLLKLGKHSGAEAMTLERIRKILITKAGGRREYAESPTTFWLASKSKKDLREALPFGWAIFYFEPM